MDLTATIFLVIAVMIAAGCAFFISGNIYKILLRKEHPSAALWRFITFVLIFTLLFIPVIFFLLTAEFQP